MKNNNSIAVALVVSIAVACMATQGLAATPSTGRTGLQTIGLLAFADTQITATSDILASVPAGKDVGIHYLAYSFKQGAVANVRSKSDFNKVSDLIKRTLPRLPAGSKLMVCTSLDDGPNRAYNKAWTTFRTDLSVADFLAKISANNATLQSDWKAKVATPFKQWSDEILQWAANNGYAARLRLDVCPVLEDRCRENSAYARLVSWTKAVGLNGSIVFIRNPIYTNLTNDGRVDGITRIEWHTKDTTFLKSRLQPTYVVSNDGATANGSEWDAVQKLALEKNASGYLHRPEFNGDRINTPPYQRGTLNPFSDASKASAIGWIQKRYGM